jgi:deoxyribonuclease V
MLLAAVDVDYRSDHALAACVTFARWTDASGLDERTARVDEVAPYEPGAFYKRELPCLLKVLDGAGADVVVVDGYVWLDGGKPGLGARLHEAAGVAVVGVAKSEYAGAGGVAVWRGKSAQALWVTAAGVDVNEAAAAVRAMHGEHRIPTLLKRVDALARGR